MDNLKVLMVAAEISPFAKAGGLADVTGSLPPALSALGVDVRLVMPKYGSISEKKYALKRIHKDIDVPTGGKIIKIDIYQGALPRTDIPVYFIDCPEYFGDKEIYLGEKDTQRFIFFSLSILYILPIIEFKPDVVHAHDFHSALVANFINLSNFTYSKDAKTLYTIHNLNYQGQASPDVLKEGNLSASSLESLATDAKDGDINFMVQGIFNCQALNTVSPTYAKEIMTKEQGSGLHRVIKKNKHKLLGILNGLDISKFNPETDPNICCNFSVESLDKKSENKLALQRELGLPEDKDKPLLAIVSRLAWQKGFELINSELLEKLDFQLIVLGTGEEKYENHFKDLAEKFPEKVSAQIKFDLGLAQRIYAGSDFFLMPSRYEPCGLGQMIAMRYGSLPIVRYTGGLADTVNKKVGFSFKTFSQKAFYLAVNRALKTYYNKKKYQSMQARAMKVDFSWSRSAKKYLNIYRKLTKHKN
ncbi:MAG: glycogen synthase [Candidatus Pacebacteria bacterium]|nr:glycogen synthase [Candidatus Paceibacterota bacterium]